ncbi:MAG TPA: hypothetical protein VKT78_16335, partial [Fimbriimonadaceae bacterium]|nr:hypothetical protein [Fimbriimonadaceae bacterium]
QGVVFGSLQKQSIIATNRLVARLDTSAVATVGTEVQQEALQEAKQLATVLGSLDPNNKQPSGYRSFSGVMNDMFKTAVPIAGTILPFTRGPQSQAPSFNKILSGLLLGGLAASLNESAPDPEIYTVSSGGTFKLTPIFEPSGQALRFIFDYYNEVPIQGTASASTSVLPRITRESIVTQVALSNLEVGQVASFEATTKAGHSTKAGGVPFVKNLFPDIPVLGYFWKTSANPTRQYSVVFAQTTMYPTITDIVNLLVDKTVDPFYAVPRRSIGRTAPRSE